MPAREEEHSANLAPAAEPRRPAPVIVAFGLKPERLVGAEGRIDAVPEPPTVERAVALAARRDRAGLEPRPRLPSAAA